MAEFTEDSKTKAARGEAAGPEARISFRMRPPYTAWLYELRLRMGQDGQLASVAHVIRSALRMLNAQHDAAMAMERAVVTGKVGE